MVITPAKDRRNIMLHAYDLGMTKGDYVFYTMEMIPDDDVIDASETWWGTDNRNEEARQAFESVFHISLAALTGTQVNQFRVEVATRMRRPPWKDYMSELWMDNMGDKYSPFLHDAVILYALSLNKTLTAGGDYRNGTLVAANAKNFFFKGISGNAIIDANGDRMPDYWITDMSPDGTFIRIAELINTQQGRRNSKMEADALEVEVCGENGAYHKAYVDSLRGQ
ncbi:PREDICTED: atrial natriuretic peptide receptor 3-like [Priapulus caudatus]|uniref:Atrial natriuretic peptide receptor 3-like n=1 Tax=Priapulus caudatus TaxID=37621 RepID=A0ABM1EIN6_PRICU|nr:PREDICTED: atrial natriuretic peptide receptor 3-like [Priapulus caudatus]